MACMIWIGSGCVGALTWYRSRSSIKMINYCIERFMFRLANGGLAHLFRLVIMIGKKNYLEGYGAYQNLVGYRL